MSKAMLARMNPRKLRLCRVCGNEFRPLRFGALRVYCSEPCGKRGTRETLARGRRRWKRMAGLRKWPDERLEEYLELIPLEVGRRRDPYGSAGVRVVVVVVYHHPPALEVGRRPTEEPLPPPGPDSVQGPPPMIRLRPAGTFISGSSGEVGLCLPTQPGGKAVESL